MHEAVNITWQCCCCFSCFSWLVIWWLLNTWPHHAQSNAITRQRHQHSNPQAQMTCTCAPRHSHSQQQTQTA